MSSGYSIAGNKSKSIVAVNKLPIKKSTTRTAKSRKMTSTTHTASTASMSTGIHL